MSSQSLDRMCEDFLISLLRAQPKLKGKLILHHDEAREAQTDCIVVQCVVGAINLAGPGGYEVEAILEYRGGPKTSPGQLDVITLAMMNGALNEGESVLTSTVIRQMQTNAGLAFILNTESTSSTHPDTKSLRRREHRIPLIAGAL